LAFQPYFTATASNVCFGYWGHDIGGHMQIGDPNPELMLRWLQFGVFSPIFRTHGASQAGNERRIWKYENFPSMLKCCNLRYQLMPYIYTAARQAYDTGISICRPLYYEWPEDNESYRAEGEYMFGDDILVSPVVTAAERDGKTFQRTWLPQGQWYNVCRGTLLEGAQTISDWYGQEEIPYFYRAGAIIPCNPQVENLKGRPTALHLIVVPGADGETSLYEDEGDTQNYQTGAFTQTAIRQQRTAEQLVLTVAPRSGQFEGMLSERSYVVRFLSEDQPQSVLVNDQSVDTWNYDAERRELVVTLPATSCDESLTVKVQRSATGISMLSDKAIFSEEYFDLQGRRLQSVQPATPCIVRRTWSDGHVTNHKVVL
jgi:alpha-glucosidase (family GH31 glycosyl hydrolase)